ncbi:hypothetical protein KO465_09080 [Candidatus Micrarchaeota archaeon]|jgi:glycosyltransferase involved in cell wall biosynthesis|nr:hypothetical protein [Candidatus Micrarchaeota archaeon]
MLSVVILSYSVNDQLFELTERCVKDFKGDETILIEDGGRFHNWGVDKYVHNLNSGGFTRSVNQGLKIAGGDFIAIVSNDTWHISGDIKDLCIKGTVTSPRVDNQRFITGLAGSFFVIPREIYERLGGWCETMKIYYSDVEYIERLKKNNIPIKMIEEVVIGHHACQSVRHAIIDYSSDRHNYENNIR